MSGLRSIASPIGLLAMPPTLPASCAVLHHRIRLDHGDAKPAAWPLRAPYGSGLILVPVLPR